MAAFQPGGGSQHAAAKPMATSPPAEINRGNGQSVTRQGSWAGIGDARVEHLKLHPRVMKSSGHRRSRVISPRDVRSTRPAPIAEA